MNNNSISKVHLLNVPLENDYKNTLYFNSLSGQENYFKSRIIDTLDGSSYQRKDKRIRYPKKYDHIANVNYVMYQNTADSNKWYYAFVTDIEYVNDECSYIYIETDVIQTWLFNYTLKESFVEREHVSSDNRGEHTQPEGLETGNFVCNNKIDGRSFTSWCIFVASTVDLGDDDFPALYGSDVNHVYSGLGYYCFKSDSALNLVLKNLAKAGKSDAVVSIFMGVDTFCELESIEGKAYYRVTSVEGTPIATWTVASLGGTSILPPEKPNNVNGYTPHNNKLFSFPFCYLMASNNNGSNAIYHYELFSSSNCDFRFIGTVCPGMSIRLQPLNYNNQAVNNEEGLNVGKLPICAWNTDVYTNWLTQNAVNIGLSVGSSALTMIGGLPMMGSGAGALMGAGTTISGAMGIANSLGQVYQQSLTPPQAEGNVNSGDVNYTAGLSKISLYQMSIKQEYARIIDKYFDMFGYKINLVKIPNKAHRSRWWYTKTIDVNIDGAIPMKDMQKIKDCYNNGITFWRNASEIQNYSLSNSIAIIS